MIYGLVVKWLSRLPVTEEIAGSNPVEPATLLTNSKAYANISVSFLNIKIKGKRKMNEQAPQLRPEKTEAQVVDQIARITNKLGERAVNSLDDDSGEDFEMSNRLQSTITPEGVRHITNTVENGNILIVKSNNAYQEGPTRNSNRVEILAKPESTHLDGVLETSDDKGRRKEVELSLEQKKTVAANVLGHLRGRVAKRELAEKDRTKDFLKL